MPKILDPKDWYWAVADRPGEIYASARRSYVVTSDSEFQDFLSDQNTPTFIQTEALLRDVLNVADVRYLNEFLPFLEVPRPRSVRARCRLQIASFATANAVGVAVPWDTELVDPLDMHVNSPNPDRIVIPETGVYYALGGARFLESSAAGGGTANTGMRAIQLRIGPATIVATSRHAPAPADNTEFPVSDYFSADAGDILRMFVEQRCGGTMNVAARITVLRAE